MPSRLRTPLARAAGYDISLVEPHALHDFPLPLTVFQHDERNAVHHGADPGEALRGRRNEPAHERDSKDGANGIHFGAVIADDGSNNDSADEEDNDEFEGGHLGARPAAQDANGQQQIEVSGDGVKYGVHFRALPGW